MSYAFSHALALLVILFPICAQSDELVPPDSYTWENFHLDADLMKMRNSKLIIQSNLNDRSVVHRDTLINKIEKFEFNEDKDSSSEVPKSHLWIFMTSHRNPPVEDPFTPSERCVETLKLLITETLKTDFSFWYTHLDDSYPLAPSLFDAEIRQKLVFIVKQFQVNLSSLKNEKAWICSAARDKLDQYFVQQVALPN